MMLTTIDKNNFDAFADILPFDELPPKDGTCICLGAIENEKTAGAAVMTVSEDEAYLSSIYVIPEFRRQGIGKALMKELAEAAKTFQTGALNTDFFPDEALSAFFSSLGYLVLPADTLCYTSYETLRNSRLVKNCEVILEDKKLEPYGDFQGTDARILKTLMKKTVDQNELEQIRPDPELSYVMYEGGLPVSYILVTILPESPLPEETEGETALVSMLYSESEQFQDILYLVTAALTSEAAAKRNIGSVAFYGTEKIKGFVKKLLHGKPLKEVVVNTQAALPLMEDVAAEADPGAE